ncbi:hypothetical protein BDZ89DRAFT_1139514 [Hymenopellis radicata]|nr:hypothetical protein BDZ89DRAFT_1139514 [Hymenopellis radicata]
MLSIAFLLLSTSLSAVAHIVAFSHGMYCENGLSGTDQNSNIGVDPMYQLPKGKWWMHRFSKCESRPPAMHEFLEIPAGGSFTVELAANQAFTTLSFGGTRVGLFPDGEEHPEFERDHSTCITSPNLHTQNESMAAGTAFAISYQSNINKVTPENLVVFNRRGTEWLPTTYQRVFLLVLPEVVFALGVGYQMGKSFLVLECTNSYDGAYRCGEPNMYMFPYKCMVTGATSTTPVGKAVPPVWCENDQSKCVAGPKQMLYWHQADGNNIDVNGWDLSGSPKSPGYNAKCGFKHGAQNDIFATLPKRFEKDHW